MPPGRLAHIDTIRADEAARDLVSMMDDLIAEGLPHVAPGDLRRGSADWQKWERLCWIWTCSVTGHDPADHSPLKADELAIVWWELI